MATITSAALGNGAGAYATDIVVKDLDLTVSNYVKDRTPVTNMAMSKKRKVNSTLHIWPNDYFRTPALNAKLEGASVSASDAASNTRSNLGNYTQIFTTTIGATGTARAVEQAGGDPQAYQEVKQLTEIMFDVELQMLRADGASIKYSGQAATQGASPNNGRRFGSLFSFAGSRSGNDTDGTSVLNLAASDGTDTTTATATNTPFDGVLSNSGLGYFTFSTGVTLQQFSPYLYKQLVTVAEQRFNAKITNMVVPTSMRTHISDMMPTSRSINRFNPADKGDTIGTYEGDFNYTYQIDDSWVMDQTGSDNTSALFMNPDVIQWGSLRELGPNNEVFSNADASLDQYIMEGTLIVRNPAGVGVLAAISPTGAAVTAPRPSAQVKRYLA
ncbi:Family of unknown function (DUF5309) [uncultured Caudovirales phage]|uniref:Major capsid protein n=3 Tax=uncultured Caudovirales phage TaxID=2100421 RepID=A0A6J5MZ20_9CAUD|nr:Family of unknown function (DUF5309) [uncultured Caudovirales phage]